MTTTPSDLPNSAIGPGTPPPARRTWMCLAGLLVSLAGLVAYGAFMGNAFLRATGAAGFALLIAGTLIGWMAMRRDRRRWLRVVAIFNVLLLVLYTFGLFWLAALPASPNFTALASPPDFTLHDEAGHAVKLSQAYAAGPVLLVFYRGFW